jgi:hypothetical protein
MLHKQVECAEGKDKGEGVEGASWLVGESGSVGDNKGKWSKTSKSDRSYYGLRRSCE